MSGALPENCPAALMSTSFISAPLTRICALRCSGSGTGWMTPETVTAKSRICAFAVGDEMATPYCLAASLTTRVTVFESELWPFTPRASNVQVVLACGGGSVTLPATAVLVGSES